MAKKRSSSAHLRKKAKAERRARDSDFFGKVRRLLTAPPPTHPPEATWRYLWWILAGAFALRAAVALAGDFVIHPDEIMQYLEPAHGAVFGNSVTYWEFFFGARSWLAPGMVAVVIGATNAVGLGEPVFYIAAVKIFFCALSLIIPWSMYTVGREWFGEQSGRVALLLGAFWYELVGYAHKPMTEFIATAILCGLIALVCQSRPPSARRAAAVALVSVLAVAMRFQYAPLAAFLVLLEFLRVDRRLRLGMIVAGVVGVLLVGAFEWMTWGGVYPSYRLNLAVNLALNPGRADESSIWHYPGWLSLASGGAFLWALAGGLADFRRRKLLLILLAVLILPHLFQAHREYRFIFMAIPLWLLLFADTLAAGITPGKKDRLFYKRVGSGCAFSLAVSVLGILNLIPFQNWLYTAHSGERGIVHFLRNQDPTFTAYRDLAKDPSVTGVWDTRVPYFNTGGYYYLHKKVPYYDVHSVPDVIIPARAKEYVSHIIARKYTTSDGIIAAGDNRLAMKTAEDEYISLPAVISDKSIDKPVFWDRHGRATPIEGFVLARDFGDLIVWRQAQENPKVKQWQRFNPTPESAPMYEFIRRIFPDVRPPHKNMNIKWADEE